jgi:hypothetical protein
LRRAVSPWLAGKNHPPPITAPHNACVENFSTTTCRVILRIEKLRLFSAKKKVGILHAAPSLRCAILKTFHGIYAGFAEPHKARRCIAFL